MIFDIICILLICVIITDQLRFWEEFSPYIKSLMTGGKFKSPIKFKLFECSTCQAHWLCLIYLICTGNFTILNYTIILVLSWTTPIISAILTFIKNAIIKLINVIAEKINI
jgi:hypothetical protein